MVSGVANILASLPDATQGEVFEDIVLGEYIRVERIVSRGQVTAEGEWYDQAEHEWVLVVSGAAQLVLEEPNDSAKPWQEVLLVAGDYLNIPAHCRHRVSWTDPTSETVWLAVFYR